MKNFYQRFFSALVLLAVLTIFYAYGGDTGLYFFSSLVFLLMAWEVGALTIKKEICLLLIPFHFFWFLFFYFQKNILLLFIFIVIEIMTWLWWQRLNLNKKEINELHAEHKSLYPFLFYSLVAPTFILAHLNTKAFPPETALFLLFVVACFDTLSYFWGKSLGGKIFKKKLFPPASPTKTFEGALFAGATLIPLTLLLDFYFPHFSILQNIHNTTFKIFSIVLLAFSSLSGDLLESLLKRSENVKDSGRLLPGHGGFFDRLDGVLFTGIISYLLLQWA